MRNVLGGLPFISHAHAEHMYSEMWRVQSQSVNVLLRHLLLRSPPDAQDVPQMKHGASCDA